MALPSCALALETKKEREKTNADPNISFFTVDRW
jgi:hypothetical protein